MSAAARTQEGWGQSYIPVLNPTVCNPTNKRTPDPRNNYLFIHSLHFTTISWGPQCPHTLLSELAMQGEPAAAPAFGHIVGEDGEVKRYYKVSLEGQVGTVSKGPWNPG